jgi:hypothetical protein
MSLGAILVVAPCTSARGDLVVGNLATSGDLGVGLSGDPSERLAGAITLTGAFTPTTLTKATLRLSSQVAKPGHVELWNNNAGLPGSEVLDLGSTNITDANSYSDYAFAPNSSFVLQPSTTYWIVLDTAPVSIASWALDRPTSPPDPGSNPEASIPSVAWYSDDSGASWTDSFIRAPKLSIDGTPVPEPASLALPSLAAKFLLRRRKGRGRAMAPPTFRR